MLNPLFGDFLGDGLDMESLWSKSNLGPRLEEEIDLLRKSRVTDKAIKRSELAKIIFQEAGITANIKLMHGYDNMDFAVATPVINPDHVFLSVRGQSEAFREYFKIKAPNKANVGTVDFRNGRIGGWFSEIRHTLFLGEWYFNDHKTFTTRELVGGILHELGHVFFFYAMFDYAMSTNYYMDFLAKEAFAIKDTEKRIAFVTKNQLANGDVKNLDLVGKAQTENQLSVVLFKEASDAHKSRLGLPAYDVRGWEYLADKFAVNMGYGDAVSGFIHKIEDFVGDLNQGASSRWSKILLTVISLLCIVITAPFVLMMLASFDFQFNIYDDTKKRHEVLRKGVMGGLRHADEGEKKKILAQLDRMDEIIGKYGEDQLGMLALIQATLGPEGRKKHRTITTQKLLEYFAVSELRLASERLTNGV